MIGPGDLTNLAHLVGEQTILSRTGGAPTLPSVWRSFSHALRSGATSVALWYHFAIMFEALFLLTVLDAGTRVGRFMLQDVLGHHGRRSAGTAGIPGDFAFKRDLSSPGGISYQGVQDPLGGINSLWPLFGISNQLLASVALVVGTTILLKMGKLRWIWVTTVPMLMLVGVTMTAAFQKIFSPDAHLGFLAQARLLSTQIAVGAIPPDRIAATHRLIFNNRLDAVVTGALVLMVIALIVEAVGVWKSILWSGETAELHESAYVTTRWVEGD